MKSIKINTSKLIVLGSFFGFLCAISIQLQPTQALSTYTVSNTNDSGAGSLRQAIEDANSSFGTDQIVFSVGTGHIQIIPTSPLPAVTDTVTIDGTSQPGFVDSPIVELSGNGSGANARGLYFAGNASGSTVKGLVINNFSSQGIWIDTSNITVTGNYIGTDWTGNMAAPNGGDGIGIFDGANDGFSVNNNVIGGDTALERNLISGNLENGVVINAQSGGATSNNVISGNYIGTNASGTSAIPNGADGILINDAGGGTANGNIIGGASGTSPGGSCTGSCNLLSGNGYNGLGLWHEGVTNTTILGNYVGVDVSGSTAMANFDIGIEINETANNSVGNATANGRNIASGNLGAGIFITGSLAYSNTVEGNYVGTSSDGGIAIPNIKMGIGIGYSPGIQPAHGNTIGSNTNKSAGTCDGGCNLISGNEKNGILLSDTYGNSISHNQIGTKTPSCSTLGNGTDGIGMVNSSNNSISQNTISANGDNGLIITGSNSGNRVESNTIGGCYGNGGAGIMVSSGVDNAFLGNNISRNGKLGIDLGYNNVSYNDLGDGDSGANSTQNYPDVYAVHSVSGSSYISGTLNSRPNTSYRIEFFQSDGCNAGKPFNFGEGQQYVGYKTITTDQYGNKVFTYPTPSPLAGNKYITSTATKLIGSTPAETSEFSKCRLVNTTRPALTNGANWYLKDDLTTGQYDTAFGYGFPSHLLMCAWDANQKGVRLPVVYSNGTWFMRASYTTGTADLVVNYGAADGTPICGDWDGDGVETIGIFKNGSWSLRNSNSSGAADLAFSYGSPGDKPVAGDWNADGSAGIGVVTTSSGLSWNLRNTPTNGAPNYTFSYGGNSGLPVVGDWDGNGNSDIGVVYGATWNVRTSLSSGAPTGAFAFDPSGYIPSSW